MLHWDFYYTGVILVSTNKNHTSSADPWQEATVGLFFLKSDSVVAAPILFCICKTKLLTLVVFFFIIFFTFLLVRLHILNSKTGSWPIGQPFNRSRNIWKWLFSQLSWRLNCIEPVVLDLDMALKPLPHCSHVNSSPPLQWTTVLDFLPGLSKEHKPPDSSH